MPTETEIQKAIAEGRATFDVDGKVSAIDLGQDEDGMARIQLVGWSL